MKTVTNTEFFSRPEFFNRGLDEIIVMAKPQASPKKSPNLTWATFFVASILIFSSSAAFGFTSESRQNQDTYSSENILLKINSDRNQTGLKSLRVNQKLQTAAFEKAKDILKENYFSHTSPTGISPWDFIKNTGLVYSFAGENLAINYSDPEELQNDLMSSPSHRKNLLSDHFTDIGIAVVKGEMNGEKTIITVQMFAQPSDVLASK